MLLEVSTASSSLDTPRDAVLDRVEQLMLEAIGVGPAVNAGTLSPAQVAAAYHLRVGGQRVRARLGISVGLALGLPVSDVACLAAAAELLHNASLIHDDLQDQDEVRRGEKTVWLKFGNSIAICAGDLLLSAAYAVLAKFSQARLLPFMLTLLHARCTVAIDGQCADVDPDANLTNSVDQYLEIATAKSGALLGLPMELVLLAADLEEAMPEAKRAADAFAVAYQIADDLSDMSRDAVGVDGMQALNIVFVLRASAHPGDAQSAARTIGLQYLEKSMAAARRLPNGTGALFLELAEDMKSALTAARF